MKIHIWRALLGQARDLVDEAFERGDVPPAREIVDRVLFEHRFVQGIERYRAELGEEVEVYLESSREPVTS
jgi:hypothetical protein